jgi:hypothetical protein
MFLKKTLSFCASKYNVVRQDKVVNSIQKLVAQCKIYSSMCPEVDSVSKNEYQDIPGGKDGRCVRVTTLPPSCAECLEILVP